MGSAAQRWLDLPGEDLETASLLRERGVLGPASFHAQQGAGQVTEWSTKQL